jgi:uncharacterized protein YecE (DUF72 family)
VHRAVAQAWPLLWQLPPNFPRDDERLRATLASLPREEKHAFEFRHGSWFVDAVYDALREHGAALVITGEREVFTAPWTYVRFHHGVRGRRGNYSESELQEWAARIRGWDVDLYAYFNNDWEAFAPRNALRLKKLLQ